MCCGWPHSHFQKWKSLGPAPNSHDDTTKNGIFFQVNSKHGNDVFGKFKKNIENSRNMLRNIRPNNGGFFVAAPHGSLFVVGA
jgi:hypothetical protein